MRKTIDAYDVAPTKVAAAQRGWEKTVLSGRRSVAAPAAAGARWRGASGFCPARQQQEEQRVGARRGGKHAREGRRQGVASVLRVLRADDRADDPAGEHPGDGDRSLERVGHAQRRAEAVVLRVREANAGERGADREQRERAQLARERAQHGAEQADERAEQVRAPAAQPLDLERQREVVEARPSVMMAIGSVRSRRRKAGRREVEDAAPAVSVEEGERPAEGEDEDGEPPALLGHGVT